MTGFDDIGNQGFVPPFTGIRQMPLKPLVVSLPPERRLLAQRCQACSGIYFLGGLIMM